MQKQFIVSAYICGKPGASFKTKFMGSVVCEAKVVAKVIEQIRSEYAYSCAPTQMVTVTVQKLVSVP